jgi:outer membrane protein TolC
LVLYVVALALALVPAPSPSPSPFPQPISTARPILPALPQSDRGLVLPPAPAIEPGFTAAPMTPPEGGLAGVDGPFIGLSLENAIGMALARNPDLGVAQANRRIAADQIVAARGAYDLSFQLVPSYSYAKSAALSSFAAGPNGAPTETIAAAAAAGIGGRTTSGGRFSATTSASRVNNNLAFNSYDPYYQTALGISFTQPLARGRSIDDPRRTLALSKINADLADDTALLDASNTVDAVLNAYYNLVAAWKNVAIQEDALRQAKAQSESNGRLVKRGAAAPVDVVESDTQVDEFQDDVYSAIANVASQQNALKSLILNDPADPAWTANLVPTSPISTVVPEPAVADVVVEALKRRPEVAQLRESIREQDVNVAYASDQRKPQIDLTLGITENGFAGAPTPSNLNPFSSVIGAEVAAIDQLIARVNAAAAPGTTPLVPIAGSGLNAPLFPGTVGGIGQSYATALQGKFPTYSISATIGFPLVNRAAKSQYAAELERRRSLETQEVGVIERIQAEARNAVQGYRSARSRLIAAAAARSAAEQVAASEGRKFRAGQSTTFLVLQRQVALANARGRELQAQSDVQKALVELDRVSGTLLEHHQVDVSALGTAPHGSVPNLVAPR